jgi:uncharacterized membrane protein
MKNIALLALALAGCTSAAEPTGIADLSCPTDSSLTYANFGSTFLTDNCLECHSGKEKPNLSTQAYVQSNASKMLEEAVYTNAMPDGSAMTNDERSLLGEWLACGAP